MHVRQERSLSQSCSNDSSKVSGDDAEEGEQRTCAKVVPVEGLACAGDDSPVGRHGEVRFGEDGLDSLREEGIDKAVNLR